MDQQRESRIINKTVHIGMDWAEVFVRETVRPDDQGKIRHSATFACVSSYGTYGYYWSHMGQPFSEFVVGMSPCYLLSKISRRDAFDEKAFDKWLRKEIFTSRATREEKTAAVNRWKELRDSYSGRMAAHVAYDDTVVFNATSGDWSDSDSDVYPLDARMFVERMWPSIVEALQEKQGASAA